MQVTTDVIGTAYVTQQEVIDAAFYQSWRTSARIDGVRSARLP